MDKKTAYIYLKLGISRKAESSLVDLGPVYQMLTVKNNN